MTALRSMWQLTNIGPALLALILFGCGSSERPLAAAMTPTPIVTPTPTATLLADVPTPTCTPPQQLTASFQFTIQPTHPSVGDLVALYVQDDLGYVNLRTSWHLSGTEAVFDDVRIGAFEGGVTASMKAVVAGTANVRLVGSYQYDLACYPGSVVGTVQSDTFAISVTEAPATAQGALAALVPRLCAAPECEVIDLEPSPSGAVVYFELFRDRYVQHVAIDGYATAADAARAFGSRDPATVELEEGLLRILSDVPDFCAASGCLDQEWAWLRGCWILRGSSFDGSPLRLAPQPAAIVEEFLQSPESIALLQLCPGN